MIQRFFNSINISTTFSIAIALCLAVTFAGCAKKDLSDTEQVEVQLDSPFLNRVVDITYEYDYYGELFTVVSRVDRETMEVLSVSGDVEKAEALFGKEEGAPEGFVHDVTNLEASAESRVLVFDTRAEADAYVGFGGENTSQHCQYFESNGSATYRFYEHANFVNELWDLTKTNKEWLGWNYVMNHNNDKISSVKVQGNDCTWSSTCESGFLGLYTDMCYGGQYMYFKTTSNVLSIPDLETYTVGGATYISSLHGIAPYMNDQTSSIRGFWRY